MTLGTQKLGYYPVHIKQCIDKCYEQLLGKRSTLWLFELQLLLKSTQQRLHGVAGNSRGAVALDPGRRQLCLTGCWAS